MVSSVVGLGVEIIGLDCAIGDLVIIGDGQGVDAEVVATNRDSIRCMPLGRLTGINAGTPAKAKGVPLLVPTGAGLFGRVLDGIGRPIDGKGPLVFDSWCRWTTTPRPPCTGHGSTPRCSWACACWTR